MFNRNSKMINELKLEIENVKKAIGYNESRDSGIIDFYFGRSEVIKSRKIIALEEKIGLLLSYLGLEVKDTCSESLPKIVKMKKNIKK